MEENRDQAVARDSHLAAELHHVLNVVQIVAALLADRRRRLVNPVAREQIEWVEQIFQCLMPLARPYQGGGDGGFDDHFRRQMDGWRKLCANRGIVLEVDVEKAAIPANLQINLSIIANELVINALKHAFPDRGGGRICVALRQVDEQCAKLLVADDGIGLPPDSHRTGLGLGLVERLAGHMGARLSIESAGGVTARLWLPLASDADGAAAV